MFSSSGSYKKCLQRLSKLKHIPQQGQKWAEDSSSMMHDELLGNLKTQGRSSPPPLTLVTRKLYKLRGNPNGSGIRNHIKVAHAHGKGKSVSIVGILNGKPTMIAKVQNRGIVIRLTDKMRAWFAAHQIYLSPATKEIYVPGRRFWDKAWTKTKKQSARNLKQIFRKR